MCCGDNDDSFCTTSEKSCWIGQTYCSSFARCCRWYIQHSEREHAWWLESSCNNLIFDVWCIVYCVMGFFSDLFMLVFQVTLLLRQCRCGLELYRRVSWSTHTHTHTWLFTYFFIPSPIPTRHRFPNVFIGITGAITFNNNRRLQQVVEQVPLHRLLLETDGPYMVPTIAKQQYGERVCHSGLIPEIAAAIAKIKRVSLEEVYRQTREATKNMYGIWLVEKSNMKYCCVRHTSFITSQH